MNFYSYVIYKLYSWAKRRPNDTPVANVILTLSFVHFVQIFAVFLIILKFVPTINIFNAGQRMYLYVFGLLFILLNYLILYNKKRWEGYIVKFGNENKNQSRRGKLYVLGYLIGSIMFFFVSSIIVYGRY